MFFNDIIRINVLALGLLIVTTTSAGASSNRDAASTTPDIVIAGATLIDGTGSGPVDDSLIYVKDGKIQRVESGKKSPAPVDDVRVIDARGKFIVPGIVDAHTHIDSLGAIALTDEQSKVVRNYYPRAFLFHGVTTVLNMSAHDTDAVLAMRNEVIRNPRAVLPRIYSGASAFTAASGWGGRHGGGVKSAAEIEARLEEYEDREVDLVKVINEEGLGSEDVFPRISDDYISKITEISRDKGLPVFVHATDENEYLESIAFQPRAMAHGLFTPQASGSPVVTRLKENEIFVVPTIVLFEAFYSVRDNPSVLDDPLLKQSVPDFILKAMHDSEQVNALFAEMDRILKMDSSAWALSAVPDLKTNVKLFAEEGIRIAVGSDGGGAVVHSFQGYNTPLEMETLAECCLDNMETIVAATKTAAEIMGAGDKFGTLQAGRSADLLILNADPLIDMGAMRDFDRLMLRGQLIDRSALTWQTYSDRTANQH